MLVEALEAMQLTAAGPSAVASEASTLSSDYYAFQQTATPQDQEHNLQRIAGGSFLRIPGSGSGSSFADVCRAAGRRGSQGLNCQYVLDWEGTRHACDVSADDGSRIARCASGDSIADQRFPEQRREANQVAVDALRRHTRTITFMVRATESECARPGAFLDVLLRVEGVIVQEKGGITQTVTGVWFGDYLPYVEGFGGLQVPSGDSMTSSGHWDQFGCQPKTFVLTYDTRRNPGGAPVDFHWSSSFHDYNLNRRDANTLKVNHGVTYSYKGADG